MSWLSDRLKEAVAQVNPFDHGQTAATVRASRPSVAPARPPQQMQAAPQQQQRSIFSSVFHDITHNPITNFVGNDIVKPFMNAPQTFNNDVIKPLNRDVVQPVLHVPTAVDNFANRSAFGRGAQAVGLGAARSVVGTGQAISGLYDLATPGTGTNRFSKKLDNTAQSIDQTAQAEHSNPLLYHGSQTATDLLQFATGAGEAKLGAQALSKVPKVGGVVKVVSKISPAIESRVAAKTAGLAEKGFSGRVAARTINTAAKPGYQAANAGFTALQAGKQASQGEAVKPTSLVPNLALGAVGLPLAGAVGHEVAAPVINAATNALRDVHLVPPSGLNPSEVANLTAFNQQARTGAMMDSGIYEGGVAAAQKAGIDYTDPAAVDNLLGAHQTYATRVQQRMQAIADAKQHMAVNNEIGAVGKDVQAPIEVPTAVTLPQAPPIEPPQTRVAVATEPQPLTPSPQVELQPAGGEISTTPPSTATISPSPGKSSRYASKTISSSDYVGAEVGNTTKENAPKYTQASEQHRYAESLGGVKEQGLDNFTANITGRLNVPNGKVGHQDIADAQTAAQLLESRNAPGDFQKAADLYDSVAGHLSAAGQTVQAAAVMARKSPSGLLYSAVRDLKKGGVEITHELQTKLQSIIEEYKGTKPGSTERAQALGKLSKVVVDAVPQSFLDNAVSVWKAGLLSGVKTHAGNILSNATFGTLKKISDIPTVAADRILELGTKKRAVGGTMRGTAKGVFQGVKSAGSTLKTGIDPRNIGDKYEQHAGINFKSKVIQNVLGKPANSVFRVLGAADQPFYFAAMKNSLYDQAKADGMNRGLRGRALLDHMNNTVQNPAEVMVQRATNDANKAVLGYDTLASKAIQFTHKGIDSLPGASAAGKKIAHAALNVLAPFVRVPSAFISRTVDFTPLGIGKEVFSQVAHKQFDQRALSQAIGEGATGTGLIALGIALTQHNLLSGDYPKNDPKEAQRWKAEGITPNSVKLGNTWVSLNYLGPVGLLFNAGHSLETAKGENAATKAGAAVGGLGQGLLGQSFLQGFSGFSDAIRDPNRNLKSFVNSQASSIIPSLSNDVGNATDKFQRQADNVGQSIKNRIPGLRQTNNVKQDVYGNPLRQATTGANLFSPFKPSDNISNPVINEVNRLHTVDPNNSDLQVTPTQISKSFTVKNKTVSLSDSQRYDLQKSIGQQTQQLWGKLIQAPQYQKLSDADKAKALQNISSDVSAAQRDSFAATQGAKVKLSTNQKRIMNGGISLDSYAKSTTNGASADASPKEKYQTAVDDYNTNKSSMSQVDRFKTEDTLKKLKVEAPYSKDVVSLYELSKGKIYDYVSTHNDGKKLVEQLQKYDHDRVNAGLISKGKFATGIAPSKVGSKSSKPKSKFSSYKLYSFASSPTAQSKTLRQLLKNATLTSKPKVASAKKVALRKYKPKHIKAVKA